MTCIAARLARRADACTRLGPARRATRAPPAISTGSTSSRRPGQQMPYRVYVPTTWDGKASLPIILMLHGAGANENTLHGSGRRPAAEARRAARLHRRLAARLHAARRLRQSAAAAGGVRPAGGRRRATRRRDAGASARAESERARGDDRAGDRHRGVRRRSVAHVSGRPLDGQRRRVAPGGAVSRALARRGADVGAVRRRGDVSVRSHQAAADLHDRRHGRHAVARRQPRAGAVTCATGGFAFEYLEVDGNHGSMVPMVWPRDLRVLQSSVSARDAEDDVDECTPRGHHVSDCWRSPVDAVAQSATGDPALARQGAGLGELDRCRKSIDDARRPATGRSQRQRSDGDRVPPAAGQRDRRGRRRRSGRRAARARLGQRRRQGRAVAEQQAASRRWC